MNCRHEQILLVAFVVLFGMVYLFPTVVEAADNTLGDFERPYEDDSSRPVEKTDEDTDGLEAVASDFVLAMGNGLMTSFLPERGRFYQPSPYDRPEEPAWSDRPDIRNQSAYQGYTLTARTDYYYVDDDLDGVGVDLGMRFSPGFSLDGSVTNYTEDINNGIDDDLTHWDMHLSMDLAPTSNLMFSPGVGGVGLSGDDHHSGPSYGMGVQWLPGKPLVVSGSVHHGIVSGEDLIDYRSRLHLNVERLDLTVGYRSLRNTEGTDLSGPTLGLSVWF